MKEKGGRWKGSVVIKFQIVITTPVFADGFHGGA